MAPERVARAEAAVVEIERAVAVDKAHERRIEPAERVVAFPVLARRDLHDPDRLLRPCDRALDVGEQIVALRRRQVLVHPAGYRATAVDALPGGDPDHLLPELAQQHALLRQVWVRGGDGEDVPALGRRVEAEQEIGRAQMEEVKRV